MMHHSDTTHRRDVTPIAEFAWATAQPGRHLRPGHRKLSKVRVQEIRSDCVDGRTVVAAQLDGSSYYTVWEMLERVRPRGLLSLRWAPHDRAPAVGALAGAGLVVAAGLSVFGMPPVS